MFGGKKEMGEPTPTGEKYVGNVKSASHKFGFITCDEIMAKYGCDCFCLGGQLSMFTIGDPVEFELGITDEGKPVAVTVTGKDGRTATFKNPHPKGKGKRSGGDWGWGMDPWMLKGLMMKGAMGMWGGDSWSSGKGWGKGGGGFGKGGGAKRKPPNTTGEMLLGTVKSKSGKYGFIASEELQQRYGGDCFCQPQQLEQFNIGDPVQFELGVSDKGQPQAINVEYASMDAPTQRTKVRRMG